MRIFIAAAFIAATAFVPAMAATRTVKLPTVTVTYKPSLPPAEFDKPYEGKLRIWRVNSEQAIRDVCPTLDWSKSAATIACAIGPKNNPKPFCEVYIVNDQILKRYQTNVWLSLKHELGHCNGWPGDHPKATKVSSITRPEVKLPEETQWLRASPPVLCLTPEGKEESCTARTVSISQIVTNDPWAKPPVLKTIPVPTGTFPDALKNYRPTWN
jgi:hypothetical protein